jgi:hypothetical protein
VVYAKHYGVAPLELKEYLEPPSVDRALMDRQAGFFVFAGYQGRTIQQEAVVVYNVNRLGYTFDGHPMTFKRVDGDHSDAVILWRSTKREHDVRSG